MSKSLKLSWTSVLISSQNSFLLMQSLYFLSPDSSSWSRPARWLPVTLVFVFLTNSGLLEFHGQRVWPSGMDWFPSPGEWMEPPSLPPSSGDPVVDLLGISQLNSWQTLGTCQVGIWLKMNCCATNSSKLLMNWCRWVMLVLFWFSEFWCIISSFCIFFHNSSYAFLMFPWNIWSVSHPVMLRILGKNEACENRFKFVSAQHQYVSKKDENDKVPRWDGCFHCEWFLHRLVDLGKSGVFWVRFLGK